MTIRGILFDKDGTLLDFEATWGPVYRTVALDLAGGRAKEASALLAAAGVDPATGRTRAGSVLAAGTTPELVRLWFPDLRGEAFRAMADRIDAAFIGNSETGSVGVPNLIETLKVLSERGFILAVATNDATLAAKASMKHLGADAYLRHFFGYDAVPRAKPAPDLVHAFAAATGLHPAEIAVVGDNRIDLEMARAAGAGLAVGVLTGNSSAADLAPYADIVLAGIGDLAAMNELAGALRGITHPAAGHPDVTGPPASPR